MLKYFLLGIILDPCEANGSFNMEAFRESLSAALAAQENVQNDEERYFFTQASTTSTTTTTTTTTGLKGTTCWKCDQMSYSECSAKGDFEVCSKVYFLFKMTVTLVPCLLVKRKYC